jgi:hypothetical protein
VGGAVAAGVRRGDFYVPKLRWGSSAAGCDPGPEFNRARVAGDGLAVGGAAVGGRAGSSGNLGVTGSGRILARARAS